MVRILLKYYLKHDLKEAALASWSVRKAKTQAVSWFWRGAGADTAGSSSSSSPGTKGWHEAAAQQLLSLSPCSVTLLGLLQWWWHMLWWVAEKGPWAMGEGGQSTWTGEASGHLLVESACGQPSSLIWLGLFMFCRSRTFSVLQSGFLGGKSQILVNLRSLSVSSLISHV